MGGSYTSSDVNADAIDGLTICTETGEGTTEVHAGFTLGATIKRTLQAVRERVRARVALRVGGIDVVSCRLTAQADCVIGTGGTVR